MADPNNPDNLTVIHTPDGATYSFPNTMSQGDITQALNQHLAAKRLRQPTPASNDRASHLPAPVDPVVIQERMPHFASRPYGNDPPGAATAFASGSAMYRLSVSLSSVEPSAQSRAACRRQPAQPYADQLKLVQQYTDAAEAAHPGCKTAGGVAANTAALGGLALVAPEALGMDADALATTNMARAAMTGGILRARRPPKTTA